MEAEAGQQPRVEKANMSAARAAIDVLWVDALYEKVRMERRIVNMAVLFACGVDEHDQRDILAIEPMLEESEDTYLLLFRSLQECVLCSPRLVISDAHSGPVATIRKEFSGQAGRGAKCTSCATFWRICRSKRKMRLLSS